MQQGNQSSSEDQGLQPRDGTQAERPGATHADPERKAESPPLVLRGAKLQGPIIDYLRFMGDKESLQQALDLIRDRYGNLMESAPNKQFKNGMTINSNSGVYWGGRQPNLKDRIKVELTGKILQEQEFASTVDLIRQLVNLGMSSTRIDIAIDHFGSSQLIENIIESIKRKELVGAKNKEIRDASSGDEPTRYSADFTAWINNFNAGC